MLLARPAAATYFAFATIGLVAVATINAIVPETKVRAELQLACRHAKQRLARKLAAGCTASHAHAPQSFRLPQLSEQQQPPRAATGCGWSLDTNSQARAHAQGKTLEEIEALWAPADGGKGEA